MKQCDRPEEGDIPPAEDFTLFPVRKPSRSPVLSLLLPVLLASALLAFNGCSRGDAPQKVSLKGAPEESVAASPDPPAAGAPAAARKLRVAIAAMISPKETFVSYQDLMTYIAKRSGMEVELVQRKKYEEVNDLLEKNEIDLAFVCDIIVAAASGQNVRPAQGVLRELAGIMGLWAAETPYSAEHND